MTGLLLDVRYAVRSLQKSSGILVVALVTIALGVGANTAMFSVVNAVLLSPLPYPAADRLVSLWPEKRWSVGMLSDVEERVSSYDAIAAYGGASYTLLGEGPAEAVSGAVVSASYFEVLGVRPQLGGGFVPADATAERGPVVMLTHDFWQRRFGGDPGVVGRGIRLAGQGLEDRTVVGVLPPDFRGIPSSAEVWAPIVTTAGAPGSYNAYGLGVIGRLRNGVAPERASAELRGLVEELTPLHSTQFRSIRYSPVDVLPLLETIVRDVRSRLLVLLGAVGFILLIACTNVANLLLARSQMRQREIALQVSLGCSQRRVVRQLLAESLVLGLAGGVMGVAAAYLALPLVVRFVSDQLPRSSMIEMDVAVLLFALALSLLAGLLFGLVPALRASRAAPAAVLRATAGRGQSQGRGSSRVNDMLVVAEIALSLVLLAGAGLMLKSVWELTRVDPGFRTENVLALQISLPPGRYDSLAVRDALRRQIEEQVAAAPGVAELATIDLLPLGGASSGIPYRIEGREARDDVSEVVSARVTSPEYFALMEIPLLRGRMLGPQDTGFDGEPAILVNDAFARQHWPDGDPLGARLLVDGEEAEPLGTIVGLVGDHHQASLSEEPNPEIYGSPAQYGWSGSSYLLVRGAGRVPAAEGVVAAIQGVDPDIAARNIRTLEEVVHDATGSTRFYAHLLTGFAALALLLGMIGVYGVIAYAVSRRTGELGVRLALGATGGDVLGSVMTRALTPIGIGIAIGLLGALALTRLLAGFVFNVDPSDPWVLAAVAALLALSGAAAALVPAARATRISPMRALQGD